MVDSPSEDEPPPFEEPFSGEDVEQRIYGTVLQTREPTAASVIADRARCDPKTARKYLRWFVDLGIVTRHEGHPTTYERNDAYFEWRRINRLAAEHTIEELTQRVQELTRAITEYEEEYDSAEPADVDTISVAQASDSHSVDDVYSDLGDWITALEEREHYERARQQRTGTRRERASG